VRRRRKTVPQRDGGDGQRQDTAGDGQDVAAHHGEHTGDRESRLRTEVSAVEGTEPIEGTAAGAAGRRAAVEGRWVPLWDHGPGDGRHDRGVLDGGTNATDGVPGVIEPTGSVAAPAGWASADRIASPMITPTIPVMRKAEIRTSRRSGVRPRAGPAVVCP